MAKKSRKKRKKAPHRPQIVSKETLIHSRLTQFFTREELLRKDAQALTTALDEVIGKNRFKDFYPLLIKAYLAAASGARQHLDTAIPGWLNTSGYVELLLKYLERFNIPGEIRKQSLNWLELCGVEASVLKGLETITPFYKAFAHANEFQGVLMVFWFTGSNKSQVRGMSFLLDFNPPWEGAVKDIAVFPYRAPNEAIREFVGSYEQGVGQMKEVSEKDAKKEILMRLLINRREDIRLPRDLIAAKDVFFNNIMTLADTPDTPSYTIEDFNEASRNGRLPKELSAFEQKYGGIARLKDGSEMLILKDPLGDDDF